jgi:hypothetical protein
LNSQIKEFITKLISAVTCLIGLTTKQSVEIVCAEVVFLKASRLKAVKVARMRNADRGALGQTLCDEKNIELSTSRKKNFATVFDEH